MQPLGFLFFSDSHTMPGLQLGRAPVMLSSLKFSPIAYLRFTIKFLVHRFKIFADSRINILYYFVNPAFHAELLCQPYQTLQLQHR